MGPFPHSQSSHQFILVIIDYATWFRDTVPLRSVTVPAIVSALMKWIAWVRILREILTNQGKNFTSKSLQWICSTLKIKQLRTSIYHPQMDGLVERFNRMLKGMIRTCIQGNPRGWDTMIPSLLFLMREVLQASAGYAPFKLLYGHSP